MRVTSDVIASPSRNPQSLIRYHNHMHKYILNTGTGALVIPDTGYEPKMYINGLQESDLPDWAMRYFFLPKEVSHEVLGAVQLLFHLQY